MKTVSAWVVTSMLVFGVVGSAGGLGNPLTMEEGEVVRCVVEGVDGTFSGVESRVEARYRTHGTCSVFDSKNPYKPGPKEKKESTFANEILQYTVRWEAEGKYNSLIKDTSERIALLKSARTSADKPSFVAGGTIVSTMVCGKDPWREGPGLDCGSLDVKWTGTAEERSGVALRLGPSSYWRVPGTSMINSDQRAALRAKYEAWLAKSRAIRQSAAAADKELTVQRSKDLPAASLGAGKTGMAAASAKILPAPRIVAPTAGSMAVQGRFQVKAIRPTAPDGFATEVEFTWLDAPAGRPYVNVWPVPMDQLVKGVTVPEGVTRGQAGRWQVRARVSNPTQGPWSEVVPFQLTLTSKTATSPAARQLELQR